MFFLGGRKRKTGQSHSRNSVGVSHTGKKRNVFFHKPFEPSVSIECFEVSQLQAHMIPSLPYTMEGLMYVRDLTDP